MQPIIVQKKVQFSLVTNSFGDEIVRKWQTGFETEPWHSKKAKLVGQSGIKLNLEVNTTALELSKYSLKDL